MKNNIFVFIIIIIMISFYSACTSVEKKAPPSLQKPPASYAPDSSYYFFTKSQIARKKGNFDTAIEYLEKAIRIDPDSVYLKRELALFYAQKNNKHKALAIINKILQSYPDDVETLILSGKIHHNLKSTVAAKAAYKKVIQIDSRRENIYLILGGLYIKDNEMSEALSVFRQLVHHFPASYPGRFFLGKIHSQQGNFKEAEKQLKKALSLQPESVEPKFELLNLYRTQGKKQDTEKIYNIYKDILKKNPDNIRATLELGVYCHEKGKVNEAQKLFADLGKRSKSKFAIILNILQLYIDKKKYGTATIILEGMLTGAPDNPNIHHIAGIAFYGKKDNDKAMMHFKKVTSDSRFYQDAILHIAYLYQENGDIQKAIDHLKQAINKTPDDAELLYYLSTFYEDIQNFTAAETTLKKAIEISPGEEKFLFRLGVVYDKWNKKEDSIKAMKAVIKLNPEHANALNYLGYTYADLGINLDEAERLIKQALKYKPDDGYITDSLGWVYFKKGLFDQAIHFLTKAVELVPDDPIMLEHLGDAYLKTNDRVNALKFYQRSLKNKKKDKTQLEKKIKALTKEKP
ncbi:MAG: tetratricopeptide repeat protein [Thermodesulfobacteriota bacterium]|nr:tetratricopeptide repeat protein [Thermodesulfobacteriota bacterium]